MPGQTGRKIMKTTKGTKGQKKGPPEKSSYPWGAVKVSCPPAKRLPRAKLYSLTDVSAP
jgi:hypothetical protein